MTEPGARPPLIAVGRVLRPFGLHGEVKVRPLTDRPEQRFRHLQDCWLWEPEAGRQERCRLAGRRFEGDLVVVRVAGVETPEDAKRLTGRFLAIEPDEALPPPPGQFYPWELRGAVVETVRGETVGRFEGVDPSPAQPLWVIATGERQWLLPAVPEIVVEVSVAERRIVIDPPEGLLEL